MSLGGVSVDKRGKAATVILSRPPLNILNLMMMEDLLEALDRLAGDKGVRVVVLRSGLGGVFSAGADVKEHLPANAERLITTFEKLVSRLVSMPVPTIALVQGGCLGGGMEVAMACDFVLATEDSSFGQPEVNVGVYPPAAAAFYARLTGLRNTYLMLLTGRSFTAREALAMGLVTQIAKEDEIGAQLETLAGSLGAKSRAVLELTKRAINQSLSKSALEALRGSSKEYLEELMKTEDAKEGLTAFLEKRGPSWRDG